MLQGKGKQIEGMKRKGEILVFTNSTFFAGLTLLDFGVLKLEQNAHSWQICRLHMINMSLFATEKHSAVLDILCEVNPLILFCINLSHLITGLRKTLYVSYDTYNTLLPYPLTSVVTRMYALFLIDN